MNKYEKILNDLLEDQRTDNATKAEIAMFLLKRKESDPFPIEFEDIFSGKRRKNEQR